MKTQQIVVLFTTLVSKASGSSAWSVGDFGFKRGQFYLPTSLDTFPEIYYHCTLGTMSFSGRLVVSNPGVGYDEIAINASTWIDPVNDWNQTVNNQILSTTSIGITGSVYEGGAGIEGRMCGCNYYQLNFAEFLLANKASGSDFAFDIFQGTNTRPVNWGNTGYLPEDYDTSMIKNVRDRIEMGNQYGWLRPSKLEYSSSVTTKNKWLRIYDEGKPFVLRSISENRDGTNYEIKVYLIEENPTPTKGRILGMEQNSINSGIITVRGKNLYTTQTSDLTEATVMKIGPAPKGHYYAISIFNTGEENIEFESSTCRPGLYGLNTKYDITHSIQSCDDIKCDGQVVYVTSSANVGKIQSLIVGTLIGLTVSLMTLI